MLEAVNSDANFKMLVTDSLNLKSDHPKGKITNIMIPPPTF